MFGELECATSLDARLSAAVSKSNSHKQDSERMNDLPRQTHIRLHKSLVRVRRVEEMLAELYKEQEMRTPTHFGIGQEAVAVGVCEALALEDVIYSHHRCHTHYLAKGAACWV